MSKDKLTPKQSLFVAEYLKTGNAAESARRAGYSGSSNTLKSIGQENLTKPDIAAAIEKANNKRNARLELEEDWELKQCIDILKECRREGDLRTAMQAINTVGKIRGKFIQKIEVEGQLNVSSVLASARKRIAGGGKNGSS